MRRVAQTATARAMVLRTCLARTTTASLSSSAHHDAHAMHTTDCLTSVATATTAATTTTATAALPPYRHGLGLDIAALTARTQREQQQHGHDDAAYDGVAVRVRGRVEACRVCGGVTFVRLRQPLCCTLQVVCAGRTRARHARTLTPESVVEVTGRLRRVRAPVTSTTCTAYEVEAHDIVLLGAAAATPLPFPLHDAHTRLDTRLTHRSIDMRTAATAAVVRLVSFVSGRVQSELRRCGFVQIHTPKLVAAASESVSSSNNNSNSSGNNNNSNSSNNNKDNNSSNSSSSGSAMFAVDYFGRRAYLAQSPQLYKQMVVQGDVARVYEVGPVFRAENSLTHRHLTEFIGVDVEMIVERGYTDVLDVLERVLCAVLYAVQADDGGGGEGGGGVGGMSLLQMAYAALRQQEQEASNNSNSSSDDKSGADAAPAVTWQRIVCEVPDEVMQRYNIAYDDDKDDESSNTAPASSASHDVYGARVGGSRHGRVGARDDGATGAAPRVLRITFDNAVRLLRDSNSSSSSNGSDDSNDDITIMHSCTAEMTDFTLPQERLLGRRIRARYGVDLYIVDAFPLVARPFYTMPLQTTATATTTATTAARSCSFDVYLRGEEIASGAQRIHDVHVLRDRLAAIGVDAAAADGALRDYVAAFAYGAWPHGGAGFGLERIVQFLLAAHDIRRVSLFPRDPRRLTP